MITVPQMALQSLERVQDELNERRKTTGRWEDVANELGVSLGSVCRVAKGYYPRTPELCRKFRLPVMLPTIACSNCGVVHVAKKCPADKLNVERRYYRDLFDIPVPVLRELIENRR